MFECDNLPGLLCVHDGLPQDENTGQWWMSDTEGTNISPLNDLLEPWDISLNNEVYIHSYQLMSYIVHCCL